MSIKINYKSTTSKKNSSNPIFFVDEKFNLSNLKKNISKDEHSYIFDLLKTSDLKKKILFFNINSKKTIYLISLKKDLNISDLESLGAKFFGLIDNNKQNDYLINLELTSNKIENFISYFLHGLKLKSYEFKKYKSKKNKKISNFKKFIRKTKKKKFKKTKKIINL